MTERTLGVGEAPSCVVPNSCANNPPLGVRMQSSLTARPELQNKSLEERHDSRLQLGLHEVRRQLSIQEIIVVPALNTVWAGEGVESVLLLSPNTLHLNEIFSQLPGAL